MAKTDTVSWNAALDAAALLVANGFTFVRRPMDAKTMTNKVEIKPGDANVRGKWIDCCHVSPDDDGRTVAAILSLKRN